MKKMTFLTRMVSVWAVLSFAPVTLGALTDIEFKRPLNPPAPDNYTLNLELMHQLGSQGKPTFQLLRRASTIQNSSLPSAEQMPVFVELGQGLSLQADNSALIEAAYQWFKDDRVLPGKTDFIFDIPLVKAGDAGRYRVRIRTPGNADIFRNYSVCVYQVQTQEKKVSGNEPVSFTTNAWGPGVQVRWSLAESWAVSGSLTPTITIRRVNALPTFSYSAQYTITSTVNMLGTSVDATTAIVNLRRPPELKVTGTISTPVNVEAAIELWDRSDVEPLPFSVTLTGQPPGMNWSEERSAIVGAPTKTGTYRITINSRNADGVGMPVYHDLLVYPDSGSTPFLYKKETTFVSLVAIPKRDAPDTREYLWRGLLTIQTTRNGAFTGTFVLPEQTRRFSGTLKPTESDPLVRKGQVTLRGLRGYDRVQLVLDETHEVSGLPSTLSGFFRLEANDIEGNLGELRIDFDPTIRPTSREKLLLQGRYTMLIEPDGGNIVDTPKGAGFGTMDISQAMIVSGVGTFPQGTGFTFSTPILRSVYYEALPHMLWMAFNSTGDNASGRLSWAKLSDDSGPETNDSYQVLLSRSPQTGTRLYSKGFDSGIMKVRSARYFVPKTGPLLFNPDLASPTWHFDALENAYVPYLEPLYATFQLTSNARVIFAAPNKNRLKLDIYAPTGFFTGSMTVQELLPGSEILTRSRLMNFRGMLSPGLRIGLGQVLYQEWPNPFLEPPVTTGNARILSDIIRVSVQEGPGG